MQATRTILKGLATIIIGFAGLAVLAFGNAVIGRHPPVLASYLLCAFGVFLFFMGFAGLRRDALRFPKITKSANPQRFLFCVIANITCGLLIFAAGVYSVYHPELFTHAK